MTTNKLFFLCFFIFTNILIAKSQILRKENIDTTISKVPYFELEDINFKKIKQTDLIGKIVVLNFWGPNCPPCVEEIPQLNRIVKKFKSENVEFIAICPLNQRPSFRIDKYGELKKFLKTNEFLYRICPVDDLRFWGTKLKLDRSPSHFIIDKRGYIVYKYFGKISESDFIKQINKQLIFKDKN